MSPTKILENIQSKYTPLSTDCIKELVSYLQIKTLEKNEIFVKEGQFSMKAYFIISELARAYYYKNDKDVTDLFAFESEFILPIVSFFSDKPSPHYLQTLENSNLQKSLETKWMS